ncbi:unnamed protein product [Prorocentrum cordatum]|uniref:Lon N-terminal domain-containing protein n=1 Tax=Prorocentrum cordatum TaxID=2364126 RepID=A0ABN9R218_9DINO|nr:unnamed protein product [Polarella glacialis]
MAASAARAARARAWPRPVACVALVLGAALPGCLRSPEPPARAAFAGGSQAPQRALRRRGARGAPGAPGHVAARAEEQEGTDGIGKVRYLPPLDYGQKPDLEPSPGSLVLPCFPLGAVYMPYASPMLNIFEPRYRKMYSDILFSGGRRFIVPPIRQGPADDVSLGEVGVVFYLDDLQEVSEQTNDQARLAEVKARERAIAAKEGVLQRQRRKAAGSVGARRPRAAPGVPAAYDAWAAVREARADGPRFPWEAVYGTQGQFLERVLLAREGALRPEGAAD